MKKFLLIGLLIALLSGSAIPAHARDKKVIKLTDGSILKGKVIELKDEIYTIEILTEWQNDSGKPVAPLKIPASSVESITAFLPPQNTQSSENADLQGQAFELKDKIMGDTGIMGGVNQLAEQEEIKQLLSDPQLLNDVMSMDPEKIQNNEKIQELMNNPEMQKLMLQIQQKYPLQ